MRNQIAISLLIIASLGLSGGVYASSNDAASGAKGGDELQQVESQSKLNINTASLAQLVKLPGIGKVRARALLDYREKHGPLQNKSDLAKVDGIGRATAAKIAPLVVFQ